MSRKAIVYAVLALAITVVGAWVLEMWYDAPSERQAVRASAMVALVTQLVAFTVAKAGSRTNVIAAWSAGTLLRFLVVVGWGFTAVRALQLPAEAVLVSVAVLLFASTLVEPLFLKG